MRALATTGATRTAPNVPTLKESGCDVVTSNWRGVFAAPGIQPPARQALVEFITALHALPAWTALLQTRGWEDAFMVGEAFEAFLRADIAATESVLRDIGLV